jgi:hypothetical protein
MSKQQVDEARYYERLNLTIAEMIGNPDSDKLVTNAWRIAIKYANPDRAGGNKTDSIFVNKAKDCLKDMDARLNYNASL